jgi:hypothetical protein
METYSKQTFCKRKDGHISTCVRVVNGKYEKSVHVTSTDSMASMCLSLDGVMQGVFSINIKRVGL